MLAYTLKRILLFIPTLLVISFLAFGLSKCTPGDPASLAMGDKGYVEPQYYQKLFEENVRNMGLDKPSFYFTFKTAAVPDTLYRILIKAERENWKLMATANGNWPAVQDYKNAVYNAEKEMFALTDSIANKAKALLAHPLRLLKLNHKASVIEYQLNEIDQAIRKEPQLATDIPSLKQIKEKYQRYIESPNKSALYRPSLAWYGTNNQYHSWMSKFIKGDFGNSYQDGRPVSSKIWDALKLTLILNSIAIFLALVLAIWLGVYMARRAGQKSDKRLTVFLFMLYSLPTFWVGTMLIVFFTTPEYHMDWFPTMGWSDLPKTAPLGKRILDIGWHLILPVFCLTYGSLAFVSRQMRSSMIEALNAPFVRTARAKGLPEKQVVWKHAFRNALFPIVTLLATIFPAAIAGSIVIEYIFNIPGMGLLTINAIYARDWPIVYTVLMMGSILTLIGILFADILYATLDPRIKLGE